MDKRGVFRAAGRQLSREAHMTKILSAVLILTMVTGLYAQVAMAQISVHGITDSIQRYAADVAARIGTINLTGLLLIENTLKPVRQGVARQAAAYFPESAIALAADFPKLAEPEALSKTGGDGTMSIERSMVIGRGSWLIRSGHSQVTSTPRIRGQDGARNRPRAPDDS